MHDSVLPGSTIGILGGGQLGRMIALEGRKMGYRFATLDPVEDSPCGQVADVQIVAGFDDVAAARELAKLSDVVTYEFENVDSEVAAILEAESDVPQGSRLLYTTQHRVREKSTLHNHGIPVTPFRPVWGLDDIRSAGRELGYPCVLKTTTGGYDGKGQWLLQSETDAEQAWDSFVVANPLSSRQAHDAIVADERLPEEAPLIVEQFVRFTKELSVVVARSRRGEVRCFPVAENIHRNHILHLSIVPARVMQDICTQANQVASRVVEALDVVGLIAIELFLTEDHQLYVNELAPRPHNSGHYTYDACVTSQFEQHLRAICNLPLGDVTLLSPVVMANILGEHVQPVLEMMPSLAPNVKVHFYGKAEVKSKRKMGHLNVLGEDVEQMLQQINAMGIWPDTE